MCVQTLDNKIKEYEVERHALFFTDPDAKRIYKENVKYTVLRKNSVNGRIYKDDPTIFSWGLLNEPRCETWKVRGWEKRLPAGSLSRQLSVALTAGSKRDTH